ncbi:hypothetical protein [Nannocystis bainbridge]|uniref:Uncharacterized protein n=1 Tax=Nannocystis bainbridge TaxID=2995303 RepID=A0ABT5E408_9BACT|nr:hypothetical protein [Nannocystis bainbridge]MDC0720614.1 hypothetical protein [Nannocystis bainbridge]
MDTRAEVGDNEAMSLRAALSLVLAGPALAAPPGAPLIPPDADNVALWDHLNAADPSLTTAPAPVERAVAVAELAEARLAGADAVDVIELLMLASGARRVAYQRTDGTQRGLHLCALLHDAEVVLGRPELASAVVESATKFRDEARAGLTSHPTAPCVAPASVSNEIKAVPEGPAPLTETADAPPPRRPIAKLAAGSALAVVGVALACGAFASLAGRRRADVSIAELNAAWVAEDRSPTLQELELGAAANRRYERLGTAALVLGIAGGVSLLTGLAVALAPQRAASRARVRASGAGLVYTF